MYSGKVYFEDGSFELINNDTLKTLVQFKEKTAIIKGKLNDAKLWREISKKLEKKLFKEKYCCQCGNTEKLIELECGKYGYINCLNKLGKEQKEIKKYIQNYLIENFQISNPNTQAKTLQSIAITILMENNLLMEEAKQKIEKLAKEMMEVE